ncbi:MAG TPA: sulfotransferase [Thermoanaerobaculia bacterium]|nr:sulfotransferase [Thermoanaerobaculia bacterium]
MIEDGLFLTGMQRSGTTLLEKLLGGQPRTSLLSQPFPLLFVEAKRAFLRSLGHDDAYPLGHLFLESRYRPEALGEFLRGWRTTPEMLMELFGRMASYSGQYTRFSGQQLDEALASLNADDDYADVVHGLVHRLAAPGGQRWFGSKETICEEFVPYLLDRGFHCAIILRDPRDVITSLNHGRGREFGGDVKPTLFNLRNWRKSVAVALAMEEHPRFAWCRYEDLVADPVAELRRITERLALDPIDPASVTGEIRDAHGEVWRGNSSHGEHRGVSTASAGIHHEVLPADVAAVSEGACLPELQLLGYDSTMSRAQAIDVLRGFRDPYAMIRGGLEGDRSTADQAIVEIERLERVTGAVNDQSGQWFLFERTHERLQAAFRP